MDREKVIRSGGSQFLVRWQQKYVTISKAFQRRNHNSCVSSIVID